MSREEDSYYLPTTPSGVARLHPRGSAHSRQTSGSSTHSHDSSPESIMTNITTPSGATSPTHQHGPQLLPKIRTQDVDLEPVSNVGPRRHRRVLSNTRNPPGYIPYPSTRPTSVSRNLLDASDCAASGPISPVSPVAPTHNPAVSSTSGLSSPIALTASTSTATKRKSLPPATTSHGHGHARSASASSIDGLTLSRYGYPTYRKLPKYVSQSEASPVSPVDAASFVFPAYGQAAPMRIPCPIQLPAQHAYFAATPSPQYDYLRVVQSAQPSPVGFLVPPPLPSDSSTTLLAHLTNVTPTVNMVRTINHGPARGLQDYFWWDVRQLRHWSSFSLSTINDIRGLTQLLKTPIHEKLPEPIIPSSRLTPESENSLISLIGDIYAPRVNAAMRLSQGLIHMGLYVSPDATSSGGRNANGPHFLGNYASDNDHTATGTHRARVVGIAKSFDRWNSGMRNEPPHRRVEYLRGLAHLQRCMREHSCRYGFIVTEIEMVCVRAGCDDDDVPYFGYLEVSSPISMKEAAPGITFDEEDKDGNMIPNINMNLNINITKPTSEGEQEDDNEDKHSRRSNTPHLSADDNLTFGGSSSSSSRSVSSSSSSPSLLPPPSPREGGHIHVSKGLEGVPMTATMALWVLLMLSKSMALPGQAPGHMNVGGPGALTRQHVLPEPKDKWIPEPQLGEKRDARRVRGWIWPEDAWHRREGTRPKKHHNTNHNGEGKSKRSRNSKS